MLGIPIPGKDGKAARCQFQRALDQVWWDAHPETIYPGTRFLENVTCFFVVNVEARVLQYVEYAIKELLQLIF
jgi:hypothetical protein